MSETPEWLSERLLNEGEKSIAFFKGLSADQWEIKVYTDGTQWNIRQVLAHFAVTEHSLCRLLENIINGGSGAPSDFDLNVYNERKVKEVHEICAEELIEMFRVNRKKTAQVVAALTKEDLERTGRHPFLGIVPLSDIIKIIYRHNQIHLRDLRKILTQV